MDIWLLGSTKSGKSSIQKVVFQKMSPHETLFLGSTKSIETHAINHNKYISFNIKDFPGDYQFTGNAAEKEMIQSCGAIVLVIDAQEEPYDEPVARMRDIIKVTHEMNPRIIYQVLIHKIDGDLFIKDDSKFEAKRTITMQLQEELGVISINPQVEYYLTSLYDHSIYEAFSKVVQKLIPELQYLEILLDSLLQYCRIEKAFLFDVVTKIYVATDNSPVDSQTYEICSDMIDVVIDVSCIYGRKNESETLAFDDQSGSIIKLDEKMILYLREVDECLALVCMIKDENFDRQHLLDYNLDCFKKSVREIFEAKQKLIRDMSKPQ